MDFSKMNRYQAYFVNKFKDEHDFDNGALEKTVSKLGDISNLICPECGADLTLLEDVEELVPVSVSANGEIKYDTSGLEEARHPTGGELHLNCSECGISASDCHSDSEILEEMFGDVKKLIEW